VHINKIKMSEQKIIVDNLELRYEGLLSIKDLYKLIDDWLKENGYDKVEKLNMEKVSEGGKYIELVLEPEKYLTDFIKNIIKIRLIGRNIKEVEVERDGKKEMMNEGEIYIRFDAVLETDYEGRWEQRPTFYFLRVLVDKYVYKFYTGKYEAGLKKDLMELHTQIKSFLNLYKY